MALVASCALNFEIAFCERCLETQSSMLSYDLTWKLLRQICVHSTHTFHSLFLVKASSWLPSSPDFDYMARNVYVANIIKFYLVLLIIIPTQMRSRFCSSISFILHCNSAEEIVLWKSNRMILIWFARLEKALSFVWYLFALLAQILKLKFLWDKTKSHHWFISPKNTLVCCSATYSCIVCSFHSENFSKRYIFFRKIKVIRIKSESSLEYLQFTDGTKAKTKYHSIHFIVDLIFMQCEKCLKNRYVWINHEIEIYIFDFISK